VGIELGKTIDLPDLSNCVVVGNKYENKELIK